MPSTRQTPRKRKTETPRKASPKTPGWVSGNVMDFKTPDFSSPSSPKIPKTRRSTASSKKKNLCTSQTGDEFFKVPDALSSPPVAARTRRSSIYHKPSGSIKMDIFLSPPKIIEKFTSSASPVSARTRRSSIYRKKSVNLVDIDIGEEKISKQRMQPKKNLVNTASSKQIKKSTNALIKKPKSLPATAVEAREKSNKPKLPVVVTRTPRNKKTVEDTYVKNESKNVCKSGNDKFENEEKSKSNTQNHSPEVKKKIIRKLTTLKEAVAEIENLATDVPEEDDAVLEIEEQPSCLANAENDQSKMKSSLTPVIDFGSQVSSVKKKKTSSTAPIELKATSSLLDEITSPVSFYGTPKSDLKQCRKERNSSKTASLKTPLAKSTPIVLLQSSVSKESQRNLQTPLMPFKFNKQSSRKRELQEETSNVGTPTKRSKVNGSLAKLNDIDNSQNNTPAFRTPEVDTDFDKIQIVSPLVMSPLVSKVPTPGKLKTPRVSRSRAVKTRTRVNTPSRSHGPGVGSVEMTVDKENDTSVSSTKDNASVAEIFSVGDSLSTKKEGKCTIL